MSKQIKEIFPRTEIAIKSQIDKLEQFAVFVVSVYVEWWIVCQVPASAPVNCMILVDTLDRFVSQDLTLVQKALSKHTWYLTDELVLFSFFSTYDIRKNITE